MVNVLVTLLRTRQNLIGDPEDKLGTHKAAKTLRNRTILVNKN